MEQIDVLMSIAGFLKSIDHHLAEIATALQTEAGGQDGGPNYYRTLDEYPTFDWSTIGAVEILRDTHGATLVRFQGREFKRRTHPKFGNQIWFSRGAGKDDEGNVVYVRLITFAEDDSSVEELPDKIAGRLPARARRQEAPAPNSPVAQQAEEADPMDVYFPRSEDELPEHVPGPTEFWSEFNTLLEQGKITNAFRDDPEFVTLRKARDWAGAIKLLHANMRV
jgi:hypothetical protein